MKTVLQKKVLLLIGCLCFLSNAVQAQCTITASLNAASLTCGTAPLTACNGILYLGDGTTAMTLTMNAALDLSCLGPIQLIVRNNATLYFTPGNDYLTLAEGSSMIFLPGSRLTGGSCNASERIYIGTNLLASCNGGAGADISFPELLALGGTGSAASNSPVCLGSTINLSATPPPNGTYTYSWSGPGLSATTYNSSPNYALAATTTGTYQVKMKSSLLSNPAIAEITVTVIALPSKPTIGTITQPNCSTATGSVALSGLPASGTWTLIRSGASAATTTGTGSTTTVSGLALGTYTFQVSNGTCTSVASANVVITPVSSSIWNGSSWSNGTPTITTNIVFNGNYSSSTNLDGCSCQVVSGNVVIKSGYTFKINKAVTVLGGNLTVDDNASLVQLDDNAVNIGAIDVKRSVNIKQYDYVYWSSPVANYALTALSPTTNPIHLWKWIPTVGGNYGNWTNANENMIKGKGYIVRGPNTFDNISPQKFTALFSGTPNNGVISPTIERGSYQGANYTSASGVTVTNKDDNYNLIGNPYPSAIKALDFLTLNTNLEGAIRLWTHGSLPSTAAPNPFYGSFLYNYTINDYIVYNGTGTISGPTGFNGYIASGQGFFINMLDGAATTTTVTFNNAMRNAVYNNGQFYRLNENSNQALSPSGRIWLDLVTADGQTNRTLIGYTDGATSGKDRLYDAEIKLGPSRNFYSLIGQDKVCIQGKGLPFMASDRISLGFQTSTAGNFNIAIGAVDGLFEDANKPVFLKDNLLHILHNLKLAPYEFTTEAGTFDNRFTLLYSNAAQLGKSAASFVALNPHENEIEIEAFNSAIQTITVYDLLGKVCYKKGNINEFNCSIEAQKGKSEIRIVKIILADGNTITRKINY